MQEFTRQSGEMSEAIAIAPDAPIAFARPYFGRDEEDAAAATIRSGWVAGGPQTRRNSNAALRSIAARNMQSAYQAGPLARF